MEELIEIQVIFPKEPRILLPKKLVEDFAQAVDPEELSATITEALADELKKLRFRNALQKTRGNAV